MTDPERDDSAPGAPVPAEPARLADDGERYLPWMTEPTIAYEHLHRYWWARALARGKRVLDLASGEGYGSALLAETAASVVGVDLDPEAVRHAAKRYARGNLEFKEGTMTAVPIQGAGVFDLIVCFEALEHLGEHAALLAEVKRLLAPRGLFVVSTPNKREYSDATGYANPFHVRELYWEEFRALIEGTFAHARWFGQRLHPGGSIFPLDASDSLATECAVELGEDGFRVTDPARKVPRYFVAVASDGDLPPADELCGSFLTDVSGQMVNLRAAQDLELHLANMRRAHDDLAESHRVVEESLGAHREEIERLAAEIERQAAEHARVLHDREALLQVARDRALELERVIREMADSLPWRIGEQARRILGRVAPPGSLRRRSWKGAVSAVKRRLRRAQGAALGPSDPGAGVGSRSSLPSDLLVTGAAHGQWIRAERGGLAEVRLLLGDSGTGPTGRAGGGQLELAVKHGPDDREPIRALTIDPASKIANAYRSFSFAPIPDSEGRVYYLSLRLVNGGPGDVVAVWCRPALLPDLSAVTDGEPRPFAWRCLCRYESRPGEESDPITAPIYGLDLDGQYQFWLRRHQGREAEREQSRALQAAWRHRPVVSVLMAARAVRPAWLERALESVFAQVYPRWELCIAYDPDLPPGVQETLRRHATRDERVRAVRLDGEADLAAAWNAALGLATGDFVALLGSGDGLSPEALFEVVRVFQGHPEADMVYSDDDQITPEGRRGAPFFKPDWAPELLLSTMYTRRLAVYRRSLVGDLHGFRGGREGAEEYDLVLRLGERTSRIVHLPQVLYHWRAAGPAPGPAPGAAATSAPACAAEMQSLREHLDRTETAAVVEEGKWSGSYRVRRRIAGEPLVSIVIPTRDRLDLVERCVRSIEERSTYRAREIVIVDNESKELATLDWLAAAERAGRARVVPFPAPFNFAAINNLGVSRARGEHVLLLNNDTEVLAGEWIEAMLEHSQRPEIGAVGAKLLYPDGSVQHAGVVLGLGGVAGHSHKHRPAGDRGYRGFVDTVRNYSAVTAACMMLRKAVFDEVGGLNDRDLRIAFNDVDLCLRIRAAGYRIVYTPFAELCHHESASRGYDLDPEEVAYMRRTWEAALALDPYYNPNLTTAREDFGLNI